FDGELDDPVWAIDRALCPEGTNGLQYLGTFPKGTEHELLVYCSEPILEDSQLKAPLLYTLNTEHFQRTLDTLKENRLHVTDHGNGWLEGAINAFRDGNIFTSIPAIPGWTVKVDGNTVKCGAFRDTLLTIPVAQGTHTVSMRYTPPGLYPGLGLTAVGLLVLILLGKKRI
ncbi:MAG: YfhO family protein, partial [Oscillospiraceae bacterium]|nr:YfhO family protein [Oscillospiraceae bacterium]